MGVILELRWGGGEGDEGMWSVERPGWDEKREEKWRSGCGEWEKNSRLEVRHASIKHVMLCEADFEHNNLFNVQ